MSPAPSIVPLATADPSCIDALLDRAFGPDRHLRTAYRVRAGTAALADLSFAARDDAGTVIGSIQAWPVRFAHDGGGTTPMVMVGPVAVEPALQRGGVGRALTGRLLAAAAEAGPDALMLIGDPEYYGRFFGFSAAYTARWRLPGPFEPRRLLARGAAVPDGAGVIEARLNIAMPA